MIRQAETRKFNEIPDSQDSLKLAPPLDFATTSAQMANIEYLNFNEAGDFDANESTYHCSEFKPTPCDPGFVEGSDVAIRARYEDHNQAAENDQFTGYFLRSQAAAPGARTALELPKICKNNDQGVKTSIREGKQWLSERKGVKKVQIVLEAEEQKSCVPQSDVHTKTAKSGQMKKKLHANAPLIKKSFEEEPHDKVSLEVTQLKQVPEAVVRGSSKAVRTDQKSQTRSFLMIKEREFPHLFDN